jgi:phospholipid/cholesterol/gamma-HCH transport system substrate-binding protein
VEARAFIADEQIRENLRSTVANVRESSASMREASESLRQTAADVQGLTGDPKLQEDLRETVSGARETMDQASRLLGRINAIVGGGGGRAAGTRQRLRDTDLRLDVQQATSPGRPRVDLNATLRGGSGHYTRLGLRDFGENTKLNFQLGRPLAGDLSLRYGLNASRLGVGLDWGGGVRPRFSADLYGLDEPALDLRGTTPLGPDLDLTFGVDGLFEESAPVVGLRWHK